MGSGQALCSGQGTLGSKADNYGLREDKTTEYTPGSTVRLVWPAKNHANYECFSNIPDTSMKLFMNPNVDPTSDLPNTESTMTDNGYVLVHDFQEGCQAGTDGCGFQNCRKFCENNGFEFTVQVKHSTPGAEVVAVAQDTFCTDFEAVVVGRVALGRNVHRVGHR